MRYRGFKEVQSDEAAPKCADNRSPYARHEFQVSSLAETDLSVLDPIASASTYRLPLANLQQQGCPLVGILLGDCGQSLLSFLRLFR